MTSSSRGNGKGIIVLSGSPPLQHESELGELTHSLVNLPGWKLESSPACETMKEKTGVDKPSIWTEFGQS